jgi:type IV secretory pathway TrbD component
MNLLAGLAFSLAVLAGLMLLAIGLGELWWRVFGKSIWEHEHIYQDEDE